MEQFSSHPLYRKHTLDSAMGSMWEFYRKQFLNLYIISLAMALVIQYASSFINIQDLSSVSDPAEMIEMMKAFVVPILCVSLINLLFNLILQFYVLYNPLGDENTIFVSALKALKYFIPYLILMVLLACVASIAVVLGVLLLFIGAVFAVLYIALLYMFILPVMLIEGPDIGNTIKRTITFAHRNFWSNIGWVAVFIIILLVTSVVLSGIILLPFTGSFIKTIMNPGEAAGLTGMIHNPLYIILSALAGAVTMPLIPLFSSILYFNARAREEEDMETGANDNGDRPVRVEDLYAKPWADDHPEHQDQGI